MQLAPFGYERLTVCKPFWIYAGLRRLLRQGMFDDVTVPTAPRACALQRVWRNGGVMETAELDRASDKYQLETLIAALTEGVMLLDENGLRYANAAALRMHGVDFQGLDFQGLEPGDALGRTVEEYKRKFDLATLQNRPVPAGRQPLERLSNGESFDAVQVRVRRRGFEEDWVHECRGVQILGR